MLGEMSQFEIFAAGEDVCTEGEQGDKVYVVIFGNLKVNAMSVPDALTGKTHNLLLAELVIGDHFGESAI